MTNIARQEYDDILHRYREWRETYERIPADNAVARQNAEAWAGRDLVPELAHELKKAWDTIGQQEGQLLDAYIAGYIDL